MGELDTGIKTFSRIFSLSFSGKKIAIQILGILCAAIVSLIILGIGSFIFRDKLQTIISIINLVAVIFILFFTWGAISKVTVAEVAGLPPVDIKGALQAAIKHASPLIIAPLKIVAIILIMMLIHVVAGWIGLLPFVGEIIWSFLAIPLFLLSAIIVVSKLILLCGSLLLPPIIMVGKESPVSELNDFLRDNTLRFIGYLLAALLVVGIVYTFLNMVVVQNDRLSTWAMGQKYSTIVSAVPAKLTAAIERVGVALKTPLKSYPSAVARRLGTNAPGAGVSDARWSQSLAGLIWGIFTLIIYLAILSLPFVIWCVSGTLIYLGLKPDATPKPQEPAAEETKE